MERVGSITLRLYIGDYRDGASLRVGDPARIDRIVNLSREHYDSALPVLEIDQWDGDPVDAEVLVGFLAAMREAWRRQETVLVHCRHGRSRAAAFCIARIMDHAGCDWDHAEEIVRQARPVIDPSPVLRYSILRLLALGQVTGEIIASRARDLLP